nr:PREDICTED: uncharacterized protein LOC109041081 [Bemisia tabaci]
MTSLFPKKSILEDFDESDPLADFSLSDDDFFDDPKTKPSIKNTPATKSDVQMDGQKPEERSRKIADLFGLEKDAESTEQAAETAKKDSASWLGLKSSPESETKKDPSAKNETTYSLGLNADMKEPAGKLGGFGMSSETRRRRSEGLGIMKSAESKKSIFKSLDIPLETETSDPPKRVSFSDATKRGDADIFGGLGDMDDLLPDRTPDHSQDTKTTERLPPSFDLKDSEEKPPSVAPKDYVPSAGTPNRRPSFGRRRESETTPKMVTSFKSQFGLDDLDGPLAGLKPREPPEKRFNVKPPNEVVSNDPMSILGKEMPEFKDSAGIARRDQSQLPSWLTDQTSQGASVVSSGALTTSTMLVSTPVKDAVLSDTNESVQGDGISRVPTESHIKSAISLGEKAFVSEKTIQSLQQTHSQLLSVLKMQQQKEMMDSITTRQLAVLHKQEEQIEQLIQKHLQKQMEAEAIVEKQMQQINDIILVLMSQPDSGKPIMLDETVSKGKSEERADEAISPTEVLNLNRQILNLEDSMQHLEFENKKLQLQLEFAENRYKLELESVEKNLNYELQMSTKREEKLNKCLEQMETEYEEKLSKLKHNEIEQRNSYEEKISVLQNERLKDYQKLNEIQKSVLEQTFSFEAQSHFKDFGKLLRPTVYQINKPENEEELSEREEKLLVREKHLASMRDALKREKLALETQLESVANRSEALEMERLEEKLRFDTEMRQVRSERNSLEIEKRAWREEKDADLKQIENLKHQVESMRELMLKQQEALVREKLELASERAQVNAISKVHGASLSSAIDLAQAKAEMDGVVEAAKKAEKALEEEKQDLLEKKKQLINESWKLTEREQEVTMRENFVKQLLEESQRKKEEGLEALRRAKESEKAVNDGQAEIQEKINELEIQERNLMKERLEIARAWKELNRSRSQLEFLLPELTNEERQLLQPSTRQNQVDRNLIVYKLPAEREGDGFKPFTSSSSHFNFNVGQEYT